MPIPVDERILAGRASATDSGSFANHGGYLADRERAMRRLRNHFATPRAKSITPKGRHAIATMSDSHPALVCGPWRVIPPKMVAVRSAASRPARSIPLPVRRRARVPSSDWAG